MPCDNREMGKEIFFHHGFASDLPILSIICKFALYEINLSEYSGRICRSIAARRLRRS